MAGVAARGAAAGVAARGADTATAAGVADTGGEAAAGAGRRMATGAGGGGAGGPGRRASNALLRDVANRLSQQSVDAEIEAIAAADAGEQNVVPSNKSVLTCATTFINELIEKYAMADQGKGGGFVIEDEANDDDGTMGEGGGAWPPEV